MSYTAAERQIMRQSRIRLIGHREFVEALTQQAKQCVRQLRGRPYYSLTWGMNKSNAWACSLVRHVLKTAPRPGSDALNLCTVRDLVFVDDACYSGKQMTALIVGVLRFLPVSLTAKLTVHVVAPYMQDAALKHFGNFVVRKVSRFHVYHDSDWNNDIRTFDGLFPRACVYNHAFPDGVSVAWQSTIVPRPSFTPIYRKGKEEKEEEGGEDQGQKHSNQLSSRACDQISCGARCTTYLSGPRDELCAGQ